MALDLRSTGDDPSRVGLDLDARIRAAAFAYLNQITARTGGWVTRAELENFQFEGSTLRLIAPQQGIWKPKILDAALTVLTTYAPSPDLRPYEDDFGPDGYFRYKWRGTNPLHADNQSLRRAMELGKPMAWFRGVRPSVYDAVYPVWLVEEEAEQHQFVIAFEETLREGWSRELARDPYNPVRRYAHVLVKQRLHQQVFRHRVVLAYDSQCALCRLRHRELLDAAHIKEDAHGGEPILPNGVSMCAIHHRAFDANVLGIRPDYVIEIQPKVLEEQDGPTLQHALQGLHLEPISVPRAKSNHPDRELLEERYERFRAAG
jgi:putative restriction endonuclease